VLKRHGPCCPALSWLVTRRVAGFTCGACLGISFSYQLDAFGDLVIERKQIFEFRFAFVPMSAWVNFPFSIMPASFGSSRRRRIAAPHALLFDPISS
jgi:hypothetical protein